MHSIYNFNFPIKAERSNSRIALQFARYKMAASQPHGPGLEPRTVQACTHHLKVVGYLVILYIVLLFQYSTGKEKME